MSFYSGTRNRRTLSNARLGSEDTNSEEEEEEEEEEEDEDGNLIEIENGSDSPSGSSIVKNGDLSDGNSSSNDINNADGDEVNSDNEIRTYRSVQSDLRSSKRKLGNRGNGRHEFARYDDDDDDDVDVENRPRKKARFKDEKAKWMRSVKKHAVDVLSEQSTDDSTDENKDDRNPASRHPKIQVADENPSTNSDSTLSSIDWDPRKKIKRSEETPFYSAQSQRMMKSMGYKEGKGLGSSEQGRVVPIVESAQKGRRGLGSIPAAKFDIKYDPGKEIYTVEKEVSWHICPLCNYDDYEFNNWITFGPEIKEMDDQTEFCDKAILEKVLKCKTYLDQIPEAEMIKARSRANPFERLRNAIFLNRAALKMANMDAATDYMFTNPRSPYGEEMVGNNQLLYFADVCAGPGGFSEYVLYRKDGWLAKGFGFTLKAKNDFELDKFYAASSASFEPHYGEAGDGDIYKMVNIESFTRYVLKHTDGEGVHFMMADGGFTVEGQENLQEVLSKRLYLCQFLVALKIVREHGHFVCKIFDVFTEFSVGLIFLMRMCFQQISLFKPQSSRPANSERYLICKWKNANTERVAEYLTSLNRYMENGQVGSEKNIIGIIPKSILKGDKEFYDYIREKNNEFGEYQINSLAKLIAFWQDEHLIEEQQVHLKKKCLQLWNIPFATRKEPELDPPERFCRSFFDNMTSFLNKRPPVCSESRNTLKIIFPIYDWHIIPLCTDKATFYYSMGRNRCYEYDQIKEQWNPVNPDYNLELSPGTFVYGEIVSELIGHRLAQRKTNAFHIIDAANLGNMNVTQDHYTDRINKCELYAKAISKEYTLSKMPVKVKPIFDLEKMDDFFSSLVQIEMKKSSQVECGYPCGENQFFIPRGLQFLKTTKLPYRRFLSRSANETYYSAPNLASKFERDRPPEAISDFVSTYKFSQTWYANAGEFISHQDFIRFLSAFVELSKTINTFHEIPFEKIPFASDEPL